MTTDISYGCGNVIGVLAYIESLPNQSHCKARVQFTIDGKGLNEGEALETTLECPCDTQLYPTITFFSSNTQISSHFMVSDMYPHALDGLKLDQADEAATIYCLDGTRFSTFSRPSIEVSTTDADASDDADS